jgi:hypothetical protein
VTHRAANDLFQIRRARLRQSQKRSQRAGRRRARPSDQRLADVARNFIDSATADFPPVARKPRRA